MSRPLLLDLFAGAGGIAMGYWRAGFDVVGLDHVKQPRYPFAFVQGDALRPPFDLRDFAVIHASPPCQRYSQATRCRPGHSEKSPDHLPAVRAMLISCGRPYVIENVPGAPLINPVLVCGLALKLGVKRHRLFESSVFMFGTDCPPGHRGDYITCFGNPVGEKRKGWVTVCGGGAPAKADRGRRADVNIAHLAMGISWMTRDELSQSIPPAYGEFLGKQLLHFLDKE